jgi:hypothetical protein
MTLVSSQPTTFVGQRRTTFSYRPYNHVASNLNIETPWRCARLDLAVKKRWPHSRYNGPCPLTLGCAGINVNEILSLRSDANDSNDAMGRRTPANLSLPIQLEPAITSVFTRTRCERKRTRDSSGLPK